MACSFHICFDKDLFNTYEPSQGAFLTGNGEACKIEGIGSVRLKTMDKLIIHLRHVRHVPLIKTNLISLGMLDSLGLEYKAKDGVLEVLLKGDVIMRGILRHTMYEFEGLAIRGNVHVISTAKEMTRLWHMRLGHIGGKGMEVLLKKKLLPDLKRIELEFCEHCVFGKHKRSPFGMGQHTSDRVLANVHSDVWGPSPIPSHSGSLYYVSFIDD